MTDVETTLVRVVLLYILLAGGVGYIFSGPIAINRVKAASVKTNLQIAAALGFVRAVRIFSAASVFLLMWCCILARYVWR